MMNHYLEAILKYKKKIVKGKLDFYSSLRERLDKNEYSRYGLFKRRISQPNKMNFISEIKKASPSKGLIREEFDLLNIAEIYSQNKVDAISILTEDKYFLGKPSYVKKVADRFDIPVLAKDFFIHKGQIYEAMLNGASAILLIVSILSDNEIKSFLKIAASLDVDCLVEIHNEEELSRALDCGAEIIGINNRNLHTFQLDIGISQRLVPQIPSGKVIVAESGIHTREEVNLFYELGVNAVLIGEAFMQEENVGKKVQELMND